MRNILPLAALIIFILVGCDDSAKMHKDNSPVMSGPYLGMEVPKDTPKLFSPNVVSSNFWEHSGAVFSADGNEVFWSRAINEGREPRIIVIMHMEKNKRGMDRTKIGAL